jgi:diacylglycerol O-acyltransferase / wax synthase
MARDRSRMHMIDAVWLDVEQDDAPIAVGAVMEFSGRAPAITRVRQRIAEVIPLAPRLSQVPEASWDGLRQPKWVDVEVDLEVHVQRETVADLEAAVSELMSEPMQIDTPLWDIRIYSGYAAREWAMVWRLHHSLADGEGATMLIGRAIEMEPDGGTTLTDWLVAQANLVRVAQAEAVVAEEAAAEEEFEPGIRDRVVSTLRDVADSAGALAAAAPATLRSLLRMVPAVPTPISGTPQQGRDWRSLHMPLAEVKAAGKAHGATINDVLLAAVANGFREVLIAHDQLGPGRVVRAVMPVSTRRPGDVRSNNQVSMIPVELPVVHDDPSRRLAEVVRQTRQGKASMVPQVIAALQDAVDRVVPAPVLEVFVAKGGWTIGWVADTLVTNVRGPGVPQYFLGHEVRYLSPIIPVGSALRTVVGINSYNGWVNVSVTGDQAHALDNQILINGIRQAVLDLLNSSPAGGTDAY